MEILMVVRSNASFINGSILMKHDRHRYTDDLNTNKAPNFLRLTFRFGKKFLTLSRCD